MLYNLRTIALLMLVAGICLGVFAGTLVASRMTESEPQLTPFVEERVKAYEKTYDLDLQQADAVRTALLRHRREIRDLFFDLRQRNAEAFGKLQKQTEERIATIIEGSAR